MEPAHGEQSAQQSVSTRAELQAILRRMRAGLEQLVDEVGPERLELPGAAGEWTIKDVLAHLTFWRWWSVRRLEAAVRDEAPVPPWDNALDEDDEDDVQRINQRAYEASRDRSLAEVLSDSRATLDRAEAALLALDEADIFAPNRYHWLDGYAVAAVILGSAEHLAEHEEGIRAFLSRADG